MRLPLRCLLSSFFLLLAVAFPHALNCQTSAKSGSDVLVFETDEKLAAVLQEKPSLRFSPERGPTLTITVDDSRRYQEIDGFGASLTDSSGWLLFSKLTPAQRADALLKLFDREKGIGLSLLRQPMGASDFALSDYSYDDMPPGKTDPALEHFSVAKDDAYLVPVLREILRVNPGLKIIASPWSPPGWMKTSDSMIQGSLLPSAYGPFANYFVNFVKAYSERKIPVYAITMENEPLNIPDSYPGMGMTAVEQAQFLRDHLGPAFRRANLKTKILVFDHNWDLIAHPITVLNDAKASTFADGIAIHCYGGNATAQSELHDRFPSKDIWLTECSGGDWQTGKIFQQQARLIIGSIRNWSRSVILWNLALDQDHGPFLGGCHTCRGILTINHKETPSTVSTTVDYAALGHVSKFVVPGAQRIESNTFEQGSFEDVAFQNPDGSIVLMVLNGSGGTEKFNVRWKNSFFQYSLDSGSVATFVWRNSSAN